MKFKITPKDFLFFLGAYSFNTDVKIYSKCLKSVEQCCKALPSFKFLEGKFFIISVVY